MTISAALVALIKAFGVFSILLLLGSFLRAKLPIFQNLYLPACVIGGFIGLILGPNVLNIIKFSENTMAAASAVPGVFIVPVLASIPMCLNLKGSGGAATLKKSNDIMVAACLVGGFFTFQCLIGLITTVICRAMGAPAYDAMGLEMAMGFSGGHGMAASLGGALQSMGNPDWEAAQGVAMTTATTGLIGGIILGVMLINVAAKKGYATQIKSAAKVSLEMRSGIYAKDSELPSLGVQTTVPNNIETISLHLGLMLAASLGGYALASVLGGLHSFFTGMSTWFYAMVVMVVLWVLVCAVKADHLFKEEVKNKITGFLSDYLIVAAIMSIPVNVVATYWVSLLAMTVAGLILTPLLLWFICKKFMHNNWFEKMLGLLGCNTGVFVTGMLLIKMADPDLKTDALNDYSIGYTLANLVLMPLVAVIISIVHTSGAVAGMALPAAVSAAMFILMVVYHKLAGAKKA